MNNNKQKLTNKQLMAIPFLLSDPCIDSACKKANISRVSFYKWLEDETFKAELERRRNEIIDEAIKRLKSCFALAVEELSNLLTSKNENIRLRTAEKVIEYHLEITNIEKIEERVTAIEKNSISN